MPIEIEVGFKLTEALVQERLLNYIMSEKATEPKTVTMVAEYYDTPSQSLREKGATLRRRIEDGVSFVSLKIDTHKGGRVMERNIWECRCPEVSTALGALLDMGVPKELLDFSAEGFVAYGQYKYTRNSILVITDDNTSIEVNFDEGIIQSNEKKSEFSEVLFKLLFGSKETLEEYVFELEGRHDLTRMLESKYERVLRLIRSR